MNKIDCKLFAAAAIRAIGDADPHKIELAVRHFVSKSGVKDEVGVSEPPSGLSFEPDVKTLPVTYDIEDYETWSSVTGVKISGDKMTLELSSSERKDKPITLGELFDELREHPANLGGEEVCLKRAGKQEPADAVASIDSLEDGFEVVTPKFTLPGRMKTRIEFKCWNGFEATDEDVESYRDDNYAEIRELAVDQSAEEPDV